MQRLLGPLALISFLATLVAPAACQTPVTIRTTPPPVQASEHAMWVTRWDYKTAADLATIARNCKDVGIDTILFQVRGNATAFYRSSYEPWAEQFDFKDPGFDPLATMIEEAHARGMRLVAWTNVTPAWYGNVPPKDAAQVYNKRPEWMWWDQRGTRQALSEKFYVSLNPCLPEVRKYLGDVIEEIAGKYAIDGLHMDYIRFPNEPPATPAKTDVDYPRDARTVGLFSKETGKTPEQDAAAWNRWRTEQVTQLVREIRGRVNKVKPGLQLSAAVGVKRESALTHFQDSASWLAQDLVDAVYPMNYAADAKVFGARCDTWAKSAAGERVVMGIMFDKGDASSLRAQVQRALDSFQGFAIFAYSSLFPSPNDAVDRPTPEERAKRDALLVAVKGWLREAKPSAPAKR